MVMKIVDDIKSIYLQSDQRHLHNVSYTKKKLKHHSYDKTRWRHLTIMKNTSSKQMHTSIFCNKGQPRFQEALAKTTQRYGKAK